jgi:hypothetical protein
MQGDIATTGPAHRISWRRRRRPVHLFLPGKLPREHHALSRALEVARVIKLEDNYRSTQAILNVGNAVLDNMANNTRNALRPWQGLWGEAAPHLFP